MGWLSSLTGFAEKIAPLNPYIGMVGSLAGSLFSAKQSQASADKQMAFQASQTGTGYQRAMADMKAAGLNPMLAAKLGPASSGSGAMASIPDYGQVIQRGASAAQSIASISKIDQEIKNLGLEEEAKRLDIESKTLLVNFEKALSTEEFKLYKMPVIKAMLDLLNVPQMVGSVGDSELASAVKRVTQLYTNPTENFPAFLDELAKIGAAGMKSMDSSVRKAADIIVRFVKNIGE
jgi:hypothetical protein